jgi:transposase InsO family protein
VATTDSDHEREVHLNLASRMTLTGINQLWVADITYIRLLREFVCLAVVLDAFSRKVVGWELARTMAARLPIAALEKAVAGRQPPQGVVHHSDRGIRYACGEYVDILRKHGMIPSMSRPGNPYDNASCESFMKTLKREEINARASTATSIVCGKTSGRSSMAATIASDSIPPSGTSRRRSLSRPQGPRHLRRERL